MAIAIGIGKSTQKNPFDAGKEAAAEARANLLRSQEKKNNLAFVFAPGQLSNNSLLKGIHEVLGPTVQIIGASSEKIIYSKNIEKMATVIMLISSDQIKFATEKELEIMHKDTQFATGQRLATNLLLDLKGIARHLCICFSDGLVRNQENLTSGLQQRLGRSFPIIGASSSDDFRFQKNFQFLNQEVISGGIAAMLCGGKLHFASSHRHGWKPLGKPHTITFSVDNIIYEIDNEPAINLYKNYFGITDTDLKIPEFWTISFRYPLGIYLSEEKQYLLRPVIEIGPNGSLICQGNIGFNKEIRLMMATRESCLEATNLVCQEIKQNFKDRSINFYIVFESLFREKILGRNMQREINFIQENLGENIPFVGLYTYSEQAPLKALIYEGQSVSHCGTISILAIGE